MILALALAGLVAAEDPVPEEDRFDALSGHLWVGGGWSSNTSETSPRSEGGEGALASPLGALAATATYRPRSSPRLRPVGEARLAFLLPWAAAEHSTVDLSTRLGAELGPPEALRVRLLYTFELLGDNTGDAYTTANRRLFLEAHRAVAEAELTPGVLAFAGLGRRVFRPLDRTRAEAEVGIAVGRGWDSGWSLAGLAQVRAHDARHDDWDLLGATLATGAVAPLPRGAEVEARLAVRRDAYPRHDLGRREWGVRARAGGWLWPIRGWHFGLTWGLTHRGLWTAPEHRVLLEAAWRGRAEHTPSQAVADRVQELLREEDCARRGSSCVD